MRKHHPVVRSFVPFAAASALWLQLEQALAVEFEPLGKAVAAVIGTTKAGKKTVPGASGQSTVFYAKDKKPTKYAFVEKGIYEPNCTHTWVIGLEAATGKVTDIRVVEMSCPHAFPTKEQAWFFDQYKGKLPASAPKLDKDVRTVAKATGSSKLTTDAVKRSLLAYTKNKGKI